MPGGGKLAYVCHIFPYLTQTFVYREVEELKRAGIPLTVFSMKPAISTLTSPESQHLIKETAYFPRVVGAAVIYSQAAWLFRAPRRYLRTLAVVARGRYRFNNTPLLWLHGLVDFARGAHLARLLLHDGGFCHLYAQFADDACTTTMAASMLTGIPFSFRSHTSPNPQLIAEKVRQAQFIVSASLYDKRVLVHWCGESAANKIHVNRLGVPLDRYTMEMAVWPWRLAVESVHDGRAIESADSNPTAHSVATCPTPNALPMILSVGTLIPEKGFEYVIRACRLLWDQGVEQHCLIVGDGPDRGKLEELIRLLDLKGRVTLSSYRPQEELRELFRQAAVFTLPCIFPLNGNVDVIPLVLQEAMAMGRPVVSTPVSGIPELIQDGVNGLLAPEKDDEALADALAKLLGNPNLAAQLGAAARETVVRSFSIAVNGHELADLLRREVPELRVEGCVLGKIEPSDLSGPTEPSEASTQNRSLPQLPAPSSQVLASSPRPLRVAWVAEIPVPYRVSLYRRLREEAGLDLKLFFCSLRQKDRDWSVALEGLPHVVLPGATIPVRPREQFFLRVNPRIWSELSRFQPDVVVVGGYAHVTMQLAMLWCRRTGTPYLMNSESHAQSQSVMPSHRPSRRPGIRGLTARVKRWFIRGAAAGLPAGTLARQNLIDHGGPRERMFLLPNTCDLDRFARDTAVPPRAVAREALGLGTALVVLFVGRLTAVKGVDLLLRAFARACCLDAGDRTETEFGSTEGLPVLLLVGEGEQRGELEALAATLEITTHVRFAGSRPWAELPSLYAAADLAVLPSLYEPWGAVVIEAMASGLPVIVTDQVGCAPDLVRPGENGWIVPAGDVTALAETLRAALSEPACRTRMGAASARLAAAWGEDACLASFVQAVKAALAAANGSRLQSSCTARLPEPTRRLLP